MELNEKGMVFGTKECGTIPKARGSTKEGKKKQTGEGYEGSNDARGKGSWTGLAR